MLLDLKFNFTTLFNFIIIVINDHSVILNHSFLPTFKQINLKNQDHLVLKHLCLFQFNYIYVIF